MDSTPDLARRIESLIRLGILAEIDHGAARCRVHTGQLTTDWLPWLALRAGATTHWSPPTVGEQCVLLSPSGETAAGFVLIGLYSDANPAPSSNPNQHVHSFPDGARIVYDHALGALSATGIKTALVDASDSITAKAGKAILLQAGDNITLRAQSITLDAPQTTATGNSLVQKLLSYLGGMMGSGSAPGAGGAVLKVNGPASIQGDTTIAGNVGVTGDVNATGKVMDAGGNSNHHSHP